tara:strand:- start:1811 stop:2080 length:270 start_codon:yes stop_codon:yes gene_type:complete
MSQWIINKMEGGDPIINRYDGHLPMVADVYGTDEEAQLIAAAPELLAALEDIVDIIECYCDDHNNDRATDVTVVLPRLKEAIAKAKGAE